MTKSLPELALMYAEDLEETINAWERWECRPAPQGRYDPPWEPLNEPPLWLLGVEYRRRPDLPSTIKE